jgi:outer membrane protein W
MPSLEVQYFPKKSPLILGGSISVQFIDRSPDARKQGENFELLAFPISMTFQFLLLPEPPFRPYYGVQTGATLYRYRFFDKEQQIGSDNNVALVVTPNAGLKVEIVEDLDIDLNVRYQFLFHDPVQWGSAGKSLQGYNIFALSLGLNYQLFR